MNQFLGSIVLAPAERALNQLLKDDTYLAEKFLPFHGKVIEVISSSPSVSFTLSIAVSSTANSRQAQIKLSAIDSETLMLKPDATIAGESVDLFELVTGRSDRRPLANPAISISGDALLIQDLYNTLLELDIDWEDYLAPLFGDIITHEIGQLGSKVKQWSQHAKKSMQRNISSYLKDEIRAVPRKDEVDEFNTDLDQLKTHIDRVKARAENLAKRLDSLLEH